MEFRLLGGLELRDGDRVHHLGGPMQRALLVHLLLTAGRAVPANELIDRLWGGAASEGSRSTLHVHVLRVRRLLAETGCSARIETVAGAYRLELGTDELDAMAFRHLTGEAVKAREVGDAFGELALLDRALKLWQGDVLSGVCGDWPRFPEVRALTEARSAAREQRALVLLALHRPAEAVDDLRLLVAEHPDRESVRLQLMLALHRCGRRAEALACYEDAYRYASERLGLEPGEDMRELHSEVLRGEVRVEPASPSPRTLPARPATFVGRFLELAALTGGGVRVITGLPGSGKTALALRLAHELRDDHPDGQLYASLGTSADPSGVLGRFLRLLGVRAVPSDEVERAEMFRACTRGKRLLVLLDDAVSTSQVRALTPGEGPAAVIVTGRGSLGTLDGTRCRLGPLTQDESVALLAGVAGARRVGMEPDAAVAVARLCGHLPLALRIAAGRLVARPEWPLASLAAFLADERTRLDRLVCDDSSVRASFDAACAVLSQDELAAFHRLGDLGPGPFRAAAIGTWEQAEALVDAGLISAAPDGYRVHDLIVLHARSKRTHLDPVHAQGGTHGTRVRQPVARIGRGAQAQSA
ncbi:BTAD domain-containing putative transcriptional regulator [Lentzea sp. NPDC004789]